MTLPIVFVHMGDNPAPHLLDSVDQALRVSPNTPIHVVVTRNSVVAAELGTRPVALHLAEDLTKTATHEAYIALVRRRLGKKRGFWRYATERFFVIEELMRALSFERVFQVESDNLLFVDLEKIEPLLMRYEGLAGAFLNDTHCYPGVVHIGSLEGLAAFNDYAVARVRSERERHRRWYRPEFLTRVRMGLVLNDMVLLADYMMANGPAAMSVLPMLPPDVEAAIAADDPRASAMSASYSGHFDDFNIVFDAIAIGRYLYGMDPAHHTVGPGFEDPVSIVRPSEFDTSRLDPKVTGEPPVLIHKGREIPVANLHNHAKVRFP